MHLFCEFFLLKNLELTKYLALDANFLKKSFVFVFMFRKRLNLKKNVIRLLKKHF